MDKLTSVEVQQNTQSACAYVGVGGRAVCITASGPLFIDWVVLPQDLVKSRSHEIRVYTFPLALKFYRHIGSITAEMPVK